MKRRDVLMGGAGAAIGIAATSVLQASRPAFAAGPERREGRAFEARLVALGIDLPAAPAPVATYVGWRRAGAVVYIAGQGPADTVGRDAFGKLGHGLGIEGGYAAARGAALNVLAQLRSACGGSLDRVVQCLSITGYVNSADDFTDQPAVLNGASDLFVEVFGEAGKAARAAIGVNTLPFGIAVEVESVWEVVPGD